jgi:type IX secretion system PorP/SprF family membrane protein
MRQIKITILLFVVTIIGTELYAQQEPQFTQNMFNKVFTNPAFAGADEGICVTGIGRQQWVGFKDSEGNKVAPETYLLTIDAPVRVLRGGLSAVVMQDKLGFTKNIAFKLGYSYLKEIGFGKLGVGFQIGFNNRTIDFSKFIAVDPQDQLLQDLTAEESEILIDGSFGVMYQVPDQYYFGVSVAQVLQTSGKELASWTTNVDSTTSESFIYKMTSDRTFYIQGGYDYVFRNHPNFALLPYAMIKFDQAAVQVDIAALLEYKSTFWGGLNYRYQDAVSIIVGLQYKAFKVGYSYDITTSQLGISRTSGSHEVMLKYCFKIEGDKGRKSYRNTRFL